MRATVVAVSFRDRLSGLLQSLHSVRRSLGDSRVMCEQGRRWPGYETYADSQLV